MNGSIGIEAAWWTVVASAPPLAGRAANAVGANGGQPATSAAGSPLPPAGQPASRPGGDFTFLFIIVAFFILMIVISTMQGRKERKRRAEMLASLARHDKVQTLGGIIGTIADLRDDEVVLKVDENTNTKITFARSAVQAILKKRGDSSAGRTVEPEPALEGKA